MPDVWSSSAVFDCLRDTLSFLSDDEYDFKFSKQMNSVPIQRYFEYKESPEHQDDVEEVLLFSGGFGLARRSRKGTLTIADGTTSASATPAQIAAAVTIPANAPISLDVTGTGTTFPGADLSVMVFF